ncbi:MAG: hypothetical protein RR646_03495 [Erysipelotrichaceae bacterium]
MNMRKATHELTNYVTNGVVGETDIVGSAETDVDFSIDDGAVKKFKGTVNINKATKNEVTLKNFVKN